MNKSTLALILIIWMIISLILVCSIVGLLLFMRSDTSCESHLGEIGVSSWNKIGLGILGKILEN